MPEPERDRAAEQSDASRGGTGAPPAPSAPNRAPADLTRSYEGAGVRVLWFAGRCIHSAACIRAAPAVFDPRRRPWIDLGAGDASAIVAAVERCPTGALHVEALDGTPLEQEPTTVHIQAVRDGPYYVHGLVEITDDEGGVFRRDTRVALCRCGESKHLPLCDNTHRSIGFRTGPTGAKPGVGG